MVHIDCAVIIVSYNCRELLLRCLASLYLRDEPPPLEVWVVDNHSGDGTVAAVRAQYPQVLLVEAGENLGFSRANNLALARAGGDAVLLLNPDTELEPGALEALAAFAACHPEAGAVGPRLLLPTGHLDKACRRGFPTPFNAFAYFTGLSRLFPRSRALAGYQLTYLSADESAAVDSLCGAAMYIPQSVLQHVGHLDERFFMFGEDIDLCYRIRQAGYSIYYNHLARIRHYKGGSGRSPYTVYQFYRAMWLFYRKHLCRSKASPLSWFIWTGIALVGLVAVSRSWIHRANSAP